MKTPEEEETSGAEEETGTISSTSSSDEDGGSTPPSGKESRELLDPTRLGYDLEQFWTFPVDPNRVSLSDLWSHYEYGEDGQLFGEDEEQELIFDSRKEPKPSEEEEEEEDEDEEYSSSDEDLTETGPQEEEEETEVVVELTPEELAAKAEADRIFEQTEAVKEIIRKQLRKLKVDYRAIAQKNNEVPVQFRVPRTKFELDPRIKEPRQKRFEEEVEKVYRRWEWEGTRSVIGFEKIQKHFLESIETHHKNVQDLEHTVAAYAFRHSFLSPEFWEVVMKNQQTLANEKSEDGDSTKVDQKMVAGGAVVPSQVTRLYAKDMIGDYTGKKYDVKTMHAIRQLEERLARRYFRELELAELNSIMIPDNFEDDEDVEAVKYAKGHTGDYKLKTSEEYLVGDKTTMAQRRQKILDLKIMIYETVKDYNQRLLKLQNEKITVIEHCRTLENEIRDRHKYLPMDMRQPFPIVHDIDPSESPEIAFEISMKDITQIQNQKLETAGLLKRKQIAYGEEDKEATAPVTTPTAEPVKVKRRIHKPGDFTRNRNDPRAPKVILKKLEQPFSVQIVGPTVIKAVPQRKNLEGLSMATFRYRKAFFNPKTEAAQNRRDRILARRSFECEFFVERLRRVIDDFKQRVIHLRNDRIEIQLDVKLMTIALLVYIQELDIVKDFEENEREIFERFENQRIQLETAKRRLEKSNRHLKQGKRDQRRIEQNLTKLAKDVSVFIYAQGRFSEYLWKVFRKRIVVGVPEEEEEEDENESEFGSEASSNEGSLPKQSVAKIEVGGGGSSTSSGSHDILFRPRKTQLTLNVCPEDMEQEVYDKVCDFRQRKAILDAELQNQKEVVQRLAGEYSAGSHLYEELHSGMGNIKEETDALVRQRQIMINDLRRLIILKTSQVQCIGESKLELDTNGTMLERIKRNFPDIEDVIVFPTDGTLNLDQRLVELKAELERQKHKQKLTRSMMIRLKAELRKKEEQAAKLTDQCIKDMLGRFGRVVDMEDLCAGSINLEILDIMAELDFQRKHHYAQSDAYNRRLAKTRHDLAGVTSINSDFNVKLAILEVKQRDVDYFLYEQQKKQKEREAAQAAPEIAPSDDRVSVVSAEAPGDSNVTQGTLNIPSVFTDFDSANDDVIEEMFCLEDRLINQESRIVYLRETIAQCKMKGGIPEIAVMSCCVPDRVGSRFITFKELQEYKSYLNKEVEILYSKNNTQKLLESTSVMPSFDVSRAVQDRKSVGGQQRSSGGQEQQILDQLDQVVNKNKLKEQMKRPMPKALFGQTGRKRLTPSEAEEEEEDEAEEEEEEEDVEEEKEEVEEEAEV